MMKDLACLLKNPDPVLTGVAQFVGHHLAKQKVTGSIPGQGAWLVCGFGPGSGHRGNQVMFLSFPFSLPFPLSRNK